MWEPYLRLDVLSLEFVYENYSGKIYDLIEFGNINFSSRKEVIDASRLG